MATERVKQTSMTLQTDLKLNPVKKLTGPQHTWRSNTKARRQYDFRGRALAYEKGGVLVGNLFNKPLRGTKILFYGRGLKYFSPLRGTNSKTTIKSHYRFFPETPAVGPYEA